MVEVKPKISNKIRKEKDYQVRKIKKDQNINKYNDFSDIYHESVLKTFEEKRNKFYLKFGEGEVGKRHSSHSVVAVCAVLI